MNKYQELASRTISKDLTNSELCNHALFGLASEVGELHALHQKVYQGHEFDEEHAKKECGDILWFLAEYCTCHGWDMDDVMDMNIDKLRKRYPEGFSVEKSLHRRSGDV